jgi:membrane protein implicated in regulation of membrane protease activity
MQSRVGSLVEQILNIGSGFFLSLLIWSFVIVPVWDLDVSMGDNLTITGIFTVVSVVRGYLWRRFFNKYNFFKG